jgi:hypothetical protein
MTMSSISQGYEVDRTSLIAWTIRCCSLNAHIKMDSLGRGLDVAAAAATRPFGETEGWARRLELPV